MKIQSGTQYGRQGWTLNNDVVSLFLMAGGGHIAGLKLNGTTAGNPLWVPTWKTIEPWHYRRNDAGKYGGKLLACIFGHNICLGAFGDPSPEEDRAGLGCHGEAPVTRWRRITSRRTATRITFTYGCELPIARMKLTRTIVMQKGSPLIRIRERVSNLARCDVPFTMCQHVSFGAPFVEPDVTIFDMSATRGHTFPAVFGKPQRLKPDTAFAWPYGPGVRGRVNLRTMGRGRNGDFYANLMNPQRDTAWFSAVNPKQGLLIAYIWHRADFPWLGVWEENRARQTHPWNGRNLTRGMEFANTPFPVGLRNAVNRGTFQGQPTFRWLPARGHADFEYDLLALPVDQDCKGVADISSSSTKYQIDVI